MLQVKICAREEAVFRLNVWNNTHVISLVDPDPFAELDHIERELMARNLKDKWFVRRFLDVNHTDSQYGPTKEICKEILEWGKANLTDESHLLIHCEAGISRSTCSALALMVQHEGDVEWNTLQNCKNEIYRIRQVAYPNKLMAKYYDELLGANGKFEIICKRLREDAPMIGDSSYSMSGVKDVKF